MSGEPMQIKIKPNAPLSSVKYKPIPVPFHFKKAAKRDIDRDVRMGVLPKKHKKLLFTVVKQYLHQRAMESHVEQLTSRISMKQHIENIITPQAHST